MAIKVVGIPHWLWFYKERVTEKDGRFQGTDGWGEEGACINIDIDVGLISGRAESDQLQYR